MFKYLLESDAEHATKRAAQMRGIGESSFVGRLRELPSGQNEPDGVHEPEPEEEGTGRHTDFLRKEAVNSMSQAPRPL